MPSYQWELAEGDFRQRLSKDKVEQGFKAGKRSFTYVHKTGKTLIPLNFPLHLWNEVADWWQQLTWSSIRSDKGDGYSHQLAWLELLVDFEVATGIRCCSANACPLPPWGERAKHLQRTVTQILKVKM